MSTRARCASPVMRVPRAMRSEPVSTCEPLLRAGSLVTGCPLGRRAGACGRMHGFAFGPSSLVPFFWAHRRKDPPAGADSRRGLSITDAEDRHKARKPMIEIAADPFDYSFELHKTALLIIDMQRDFIERGGFGETLGNDVTRLQAIVPTVRRVLDAWRE